MNDDFLKLGRTLSILERLMKMYYDRGLADFGIGWGQQFYLLYVYRHPGCSPQELASLFGVDKATVTKVLKKLTAVGFLSVDFDEKDKRSKRLFAADAAKAAVKRVEQLHTQFYQDLCEGIDEKSIADTQENLLKMKQNLRKKVCYKREESICSQTK